MFRATLKSLRAHKVRLALTAVSVVLGVAFVVGTLVLTDTLGKVFDDLFGDAQKNVAVAVRGKAPFTSTDGTDERPPVPETLLPPLLKVPGVSSGAGDVDGYAQIVDPVKKTVIGTGGAPGIGIAWSTDQALSPLRLQSGRGPQRAGEIAVDSQMAEGSHLSVNQLVGVITKSGVSPARIVGIFKFGSSGSLAGATLTAFDTATAQRLIGTPGFFTSISLGADSGVSQATLQERVQTVLPGGYEAVTGQQLSKEASNQIKDALKFFNIFLLVFAGIALFVGSFIIFNTFSMLVAQRTRELALLRALGASRRQVTVSVVAEAFVVGLVGAVVGIGVGLLLAVGLKALLDAFGLGLPSGSLVLKLGTVVWAFVIGIGVTVAAAVFPARRAGRMPPVAALSDMVAMPSRSSRRRIAVGVVGLLIGIGLGFAGLQGATDQPAALVGVGMMVIFIAVTALSPLVSQPIVRVLGAPLPRLFGAPGRMGRDNALRNPRRTASTAGALMIGLALVSAMTVMASSLTASFNKIIDRSLGADYVLSTSQFTLFSPAVADAVKKVPGVGPVTQFRVGTAHVGSSTVSVQGATADTVADNVTLDMQSGSRDALARGQLLVDEKLAQDKGYRVGSQVRMTFARTGPKTLVVGGVYAQNQLLGQYLVSLETYNQHFVNRLDQVVAVSQVPGADSAAVRAGIDQVLKAYPNVRVQDQTEFKKSQRAQINQLLTMVIVLLSLAVLIAVLGIVNTLALSVIERTREIGLVRAVGMSRRQLRRMIRLESVVIAVFGGILGLVVGVVFGWALVRALHDQGIDTLRIPVVTLLIYLVVAGVVGVLAAIWPARRAAKLDVLEAIATT